MRQGANSAVRFTTYTTLKQFVQGTARPGQTLPSAITFGIGGIAGLVTVYTTMPLEWAFCLSLRCLINLSCPTFKCRQDTDAVARSPSTVSKYFPLCVPNFHRGRNLAILDGHNPTARTPSGKFYPLNNCRVTNIMSNSWVVESSLQYTKILSRW